MSEGNGKKKILIVDDESPIADLISEFCQMFGFETKSLNSGENILEIAESFQPDVITMDLVMPKMSGVDVMEVLKSNEKTKSIPVLVISSLTGTDSALRDILQKLSQGNLGKPIGMGHLKEAIDKVLTK